MQIPEQPSWAPSLELQRQKTSAPGIPCLQDGDFPLASVGWNSHDFDAPLISQSGSVVLLCMVQTLKILFSGLLQLNSHFASKVEVRVAMESELQQPVWSYQVSHFSADGV